MLVKTLFQEVDLRDNTSFRLPNCCLSTKVYHFLHHHLTTDNKEESNGCFIQTLVNRHGKRSKDKLRPIKSNGPSSFPWLLCPLGGSNVSATLSLARR